MQTKRTEKEKAVRRYGNIPQSTRKRISGGGSTGRYRAGGDCKLGPTGNWLSSIVLKQGLATVPAKYLDTILQTVFKAYHVSPKFEDFKVEDGQTGQAVLYAITQRLREMAQARELEYILVNEYDTFVPALAEEVPIDYSLVCSIEGLVNLASQDKQVDEAITSLFHHLIKGKHIPIWEDMVMSTSDIVLNEIDYAEENKQEADEWMKALATSVAFYEKEAPFEWLCKLEKFKPKSISALKKFRCDDGRIHEIIDLGIKLIEHPVDFNDYVNHFDDSEGIFQWEYIHFSWDATQAVDIFYNQNIESSGAGYCQYPLRLIPLSKKESWSTKAYGNSFFRALEILFTAIHNFN